MSKTIAEIVKATDTFSAWIDKTNLVINAMSTEAVTVNTNANGGLTVGNGFVNGILGANLIVASTIRGGNVQSSGYLILPSNVNITGDIANISSNTNFSGANNYFGGPVSVVANATFKSNSTFNMISLTSNSTVKEATANLDTLTINSNVVVSKNVATNAYLLSNNIINTLNVVSNNFISNNIIASNVIAGNVYYSSQQTVTTGTSAQLISTYPIIYNTSKLVISVKDNSANAYQATEILILQDDGSTYLTEYAVLISNTVLSSFTANSNSTFVKVYATPTATNTTIKVSKLLL